MIEKEYIVPGFTMRKRIYLFYLDQRRLKMKRIKVWWRNRHWRKVRKHIIKLSAGEQLGLAQSLISSIAAPYPREARRKFLQVQFCKIEELVKYLVGDNKKSADKGKI